MSPLLGHRPPPMDGIRRLGRDPPCGPSADCDVKKEDVLSKLIGQFGTWQFIVVSTVSLVKLSSGWVQLAILFLTPALTFRCVQFDESTANVTLSAENSTCYANCLAYEYDTGQFGNTIVSEWDLICDKKWLASFTQMMLQLGILVGSVIFGFLADRFGRKITFLISVTTVMVVGFGIPFSPNYEVFTTLRFLLGVATAGTMVISFVIVMESVGPKYREMAGCLFQIPFIIGHMTVPLFAYYYRNWDSYTLALAVPTLIYLGYFFLLSESPRWLVSVGRVEEATIIVTKAASMNKMPTTKIRESLTSMADAIKSSSEQPKPNYLQLVHSSLRTKTICCCFIWLITGVTFFGLNQYISQTSSDPFVSVAAAAAIQIPSVLLSIWLMRYFGRKATTVGGSCLGGLCVITLGCVPDTFALQLTLGSLGGSKGIASLRGGGGGNTIRHGATPNKWNMRLVKGN
ncbi:hypothetical protein evm_013376 [Chilo suppressalis]|nr:hypothetical protein evm_013376 [Chilo suppressalis]